MYSNSKNKVQDRSAIEKSLRRELRSRKPSSKVMELIQELIVNDDNSTKDGSLRKIYDCIVIYEDKPRQELVDEFPKLCRKLGLSQPQPVKVHKILWRKVGMWAAAVLLPVLFIVGLTTTLFNSEEYPAVVETHLVTVSSNDTKEIILCDGSKVWLGMNSRIEYEENFASGRVLVLYGEAYFSIENQNGAPFEVHANGLIVRVLGTEFLVKSARDDSTTEVTLTSGKIEIITEANDIVYELLPCERFIQDNVSHNVITTVITDEEWIEITEIPHTMNIMSLEEIFKRITTVYGVSIRVKGELSMDEKIKIDINGDASLEDVIFAVQKAIGNWFDYEIVNVK